ncbi:caspase family protein [Candidatus Marithrix sp. Canyon 246]|uniref:caspase family protein n=1 Tax=Candidatus Marithrix sp. Canyon 246 TaxID=1827136 RepID=UPI00084A235B|nr:caspase family protein [Candidatus Marithrix sp. Canyon 246]
MKNKKLYLLITLLIILFACNEPKPTKNKGFEIIPDTSPQQTQVISKKRVALIIGNADYKFAPLKNPVNDAEDMNASLKKLGFDVIFLKNANYESMDLAIKNFKKKLGNDIIGLFYFSGHGVQYEGMNYMIPADISEPTVSAIKYKSIPIEYVLSNMEEANNQVNIIVLDACRNNPFKNGTRAVRKGLAQITAPSGSLIAYATSPGKVAEDGVGRNSPYTMYLKKFILDQDLYLEEIFKKVRNAVQKQTKKRQTPWESTSLDGEDIYLARTINHEQIEDEKKRLAEERRQRKQQKLLAAEKAEIKRKQQERLADAKKAEIKRKQQKQIQQQEQTISSCKNCDCEEIRRAESMGFPPLTSQQQEFKKTCQI